MGDILVPTEDEVGKWLISTLQHVCHIEYFFRELNLGEKDPERPHDLVGPGNKFEWDVIKGFALQYRDPLPDVQEYIMPALRLHRQQYHHRRWNEPDPSDITLPMPGSSEEDMLVGAVDAVCSLLENRGYQGGSHDYDGVLDVVRKNPPHKSPWMMRVIPQMRSLQQPDLSQIASLEGFPNIGLQDVVYDAIAGRCREAVEELRRERGFTLR